MLDDRQNFGGRRKFAHSFNDIISVENLLAAWREFLLGKRNKKDVQAFQLHLMDNIIGLRDELAAGTYHHGEYHAFKISDPKPRDIHKATVRDRLLHHAIYRIFYPFFDRTWIADSYSCRLNKGTHRAVNRFREYVYKVSKSNTRTCWVLKCDIRKFFASIDHTVFKEILVLYISDRRILSLLDEIVESFQSTGLGKGLPLGNLTSQLLVNIYMNEFDQFAKHRLKARFYIRYADDFLILSEDREKLVGMVPKIRDFLGERLLLSLHPNKIYISTIASGIDFLGWVNFPDHRVLRTSTRRRMERKLFRGSNESCRQSYRGLLSHGNTYKVRESI